MPTRVVRFHPLASNEYLRALRWRARRSPWAAQQFVLEVGRAVERIATAAESCPPSVRGTRWVRVRRFDYLLHFRIESDTTARVMAVAHTGRRPGYWTRRLLGP